MSWCIREDRLSDQLVEEEADDKVHALEIGIKRLHTAHTTIPLVIAQLDART